MVEMAGQTVARRSIFAALLAAVKRAVIGVWHWMSNKHTDRYLTEVAFRWNERKADTNAAKNILQRGLDKSLKPVEGLRSQRPDDAGSIRRAA
jgi:hypothetical protein